MTQPGNGQIDVITDALRRDAQVWDEEASATGTIRPKWRDYGSTASKLDCFRSSLTPTAR